MEGDTMFLKFGYRFFIIFFLVGLCSFAFAEILSQDKFVDIKLDNIFLNVKGEKCQPLKITVGHLQTDQNLNIKIKGSYFSPIVQDIFLPAQSSKCIEIFVPCKDIITSANLEVYSKTQDKIVYTSSIEIGPFRDVKVYVGYSSHEDFGWAAYSPTTEEWVREINLKAIDLLKKYPECKWTIETTFAVKNLLDYYPDKKSDILNLIRAGQLEIIGSWINPFRVQFTGESYVRQLTVAKNWLKENLNYTPRGVQYYDMAWHWCGQMPQIAKKAGLEWYLPSPATNEKDIHYWEANDKTKILTYTLEGYGGLLGPLGKGYTALYESMNKLMENKDRTLYYFPAESDWSYPEESHILLVKNWNSKVASPKIIFSLPSEYFEMADQKSIIRTAFVGTRRPKGNTFETMTVLNDAFFEIQKAETQIINAEKWAIINELITGRIYPKNKFEKLWQNLLYAEDHNIKGGTETRQILDYEIGLLTNGSRMIAEDFINRSLKSISSQIESSNFNKESIPIIVFNPSVFGRTEPVIIDLKKLRIPIPLQEIELYNSDGQLIDSQGIYGENKLIFFAPLDSLGFATYYLVKSKNQNYWLYCKEVKSNKEVIIQPDNTSPNPNINQFKQQNNCVENEYYKITINRENGLIESIYDKELSVELLKNVKYSFGEFYSQLIPSTRKIGEMKTGDLFLARDYSPQSIWIQKGPILQSIVVQRPFIGESQTSQTIALYKGLKRIDLKTSIIWKGWDEKCLKMKVALPFNINTSAIHYAAPYAIDQEEEINNVGRFIQGWCNIFDSEQDLSISLSTTCPHIQFDKGLISLYMFMDRISSIGELLQNNYINGGVHSYKVSIMSHKGSWKSENTFLNGCGIKDDFIVIKGHLGDGQLPHKMSFISISPANVVVSCIKKPDVGKGIILRCYETTGEKTSFKISFFLPIKKMYETNLMEEILHKIPVEDITNGMEINPFEIKTYRIEF